MRIAGSSGTAMASAAKVTATTPAATPSGTSSSADGAARTPGVAGNPSTTTAALQTAVIQPALQALRAMTDDVDVERVAALRDAIARGEVPFDAHRLAGLIQRFHEGTR